MSITRAALSSALLALTMVVPAQGATIFLANLTTTQEPPPILLTTDSGAPRPVPFGTAMFTLNDAQTALTFTATIFNIDVTGTQTGDVNDNLQAAHIHAGTNVPPATNPVVWGFFGSPFNDTVAPTTTVTPFATGVGGTFTGQWDQPEGNNTTLTAQLANILAGRAYINFHTRQNPGGEIRGAILATPEPATLLLVGTGVAAVLRRRIRR